MRTLVIFVVSILPSIPALFRNREEQEIVELVLRQQLAVYAQDRPRPRIPPFDHAYRTSIARFLVLPVAKLPGFRQSGDTMHSIRSRWR